jgi:hypothetical protein
LLVPEPEPEPEPELESPPRRPASVLDQCEEVAQRIRSALGNQLRCRLCTVACLGCRLSLPLGVCIPSNHMLQPLLAWT